MQWDKKTDLLQGVVFTVVGLAAILLNVIMAVVYKKRGFGKPTLVSFWMLSS